MEEKLVDNEQMKSPGLSGSTLKIIAMISMFIDHATSVLLERYIVYRGMWNCGAYDCTAFGIQADRSGCPCPG